MGKERGFHQKSGPDTPYSIVRILQAKSMAGMIPRLYNLGTDKLTGGFTMRKWIRLMVIVLGLFMDTKTIIRSSEMETIVKL